MQAAHTLGGCTVCMKKDRATAMLTALQDCTCFADISIYVKALTYCVGEVF